jgi:hypothetical protein
MARGSGAPGREDGVWLSKRYTTLDVGGRGTTGFPAEVARRVRISRRRKVQDWQSGVGLQGKRAASSRSPANEVSRATVAALSRDRPYVG